MSHEQKPNDAQPEWLQQALRELPKDMAPERDLWPTISAQIEAQSENGVQQPRRRFPYAIAASVLITGAALLFSYQNYQQRLATEARLADAEQVLQQVESPYQYARVSYREQWPELKQYLSPETAEVIEKNLQTIRAAQAEIEQALKKEPNSIELQQLLHQSLNQELSVYRKAEKAARHSPLI